MKRKGSETAFNGSLRTRHH